MQEKNTVSVHHVLALAVVGFTTALPAEATIVQVPEPSSLALFGIGLVGAILLARYANRR